MSQNVRFYFGLQSKYDALTEKNPLALYFIEDTNRLYKGDVLIATGAVVSSMAAGLMSKEDKAKLDELVASGSGIRELVSVDGSLVIADTENGGKSIGVAISTQEGNAIVAVEDGLFVPSAKEISVPEYSIEKQTVADEGYAVSYKLKKIVDGEVSYVGDTINVAKDMVLQSASMQVVTEDNVPYDGAVVGDPYIDMAFNDESASHIYIPVKGLVDTYTAGDGIKIVDGNISVNIASESNGLDVVDGALKMQLATAESAGSLSAKDKVFIDAIPSTYSSIERVKDTAVQVKYEITSIPVGTLVNYGEDEIRIMCPDGIEWNKQNVGVGGDPNCYYATFKTYAPNDNVVGYIEHLGSQVDSEVLTDLSTDEYGRRYQPTWLALARYDEATDTWTYYGDNSTEDKYIGWDYQIDWYDANGVMVATDSIRINLSNKDCHNNSKPYYLTKYATVEQIEKAVEQIEKIEETLVWSEIVEF